MCLFPGRYIPVVTAPWVPTCGAVPMWRLVWGTGIVLQNGMCCSWHGFCITSIFSYGLTIEALVSILAMVLMVAGYGCWYSKRTASFSLALMIRTDRIIASIPCASVMLCIVNRKLFIEIVWKRAIYVLIKNSTFVNFTLSVKRYPFQLSKKCHRGCQVVGI